METQCDGRALVCHRHRERTALLVILWQLITFVPPLLSAATVGVQTLTPDLPPHFSSASLRSAPANVHAIVQPESSVRRTDLILEFRLALISSNLKTPTTFLKPRGLLLRDR